MFHCRLPLISDVRGVTIYDARLVHMPDLFCCHIPLSHAPMPPQPPSLSPPYPTPPTPPHATPPLSTPPYLWTKIGQDVDTGPSSTITTARRLLGL